MISKLLFGANGFIQKGYAGYSTIRALRFDRETAANISATFDNGTENALCNSKFKAYSGGGNSSPYNKIYALVFSAKETSSLLAATLNVGRCAMCAVNSTTNGYWMGGYVVATNDASAEIDGIQFSSETATNPAAALSQITIQNTTGVCAPTKGYSVNGATYTPGNPYVTVKTVNYITYSTETITNLGNASSSSSRRPASVNSSTNGYIALGYINQADPYTSAPLASKIVDKVVFSTDTFTSLGAVLSVGRNNGASFNNNLVGYICGGDTQYDTGGTSNVDKIVFSSEAWSLVSSASYGLTSTTGAQNGGFL